MPKIISQSENELSHLPDLWSDPGPLCPLQVHVQHAAADTALLHPKSQDLYLATGGGRAGPVTSTFLMRRQRLRGAEYRAQVPEPECRTPTSGSQCSVCSAH